MKTLKFSIGIAAFLAIMTMAQAQSCVTTPSGLVAWWKGDSTTVDTVATNNGVAVNASYTNGIVGQAFYISEDTGGGWSGIQVPDQPAYALTNSLTIECWIYPQIYSHCWSIFWRGDSRSGLDPYFVSMGGTSNVSFIINATNGSGASVSAPVALKIWTHIAATLDDTTGTMSIYTNGVLADQTITTLRPLGNLIAGDHPGVCIGNVNDGFNNFSWDGGIDEVSLYNRALTPTEIQSIYNAGSAGKCNGTPVAPTISPQGQPQDELIFAHQTGSFSVVATGTGPLSYQWCFDGNRIDFRTSSLLTVTNVQDFNLGTYTVVVTNIAGAVTSNPVMFFMYPHIENPFTGLVAYWGQTNILSVGAWGNDLNYQWYFNGVAIDGATGSTFTIPSIQFTNAGLYSVVVSSLLGSVTNTPEQVVVNPANVSLIICPNVVIQGTVGYSYIIQSSTDLSDTNSWITMTNLTLAEPIQYWDDTSTDVRQPDNPYKFYRVLPGQ